jgi:hypothetical protein
MRRVIPILGVVLLFAGIGQADILVDFGWRFLPNAPETDGKYWNGALRFVGASPGTWMEVQQNWDGSQYPPLGELVDHTGATQSGVHLYAMDIPGTSGNFGTVGAPYPDNVTKDLWNGQGSDNANPAGVKFTGLAPGTYEMNIRVQYPSDPWVYGAGQYTCQGTTYIYDNAGVQVYNFQNLSPVGGEIVLWMEDYTPMGETRPTYNAISLIELIPEPTTLSLLALGALAAIRRRK